MTNFLQNLTQLEAIFPGMKGRLDATGELDAVEVIESRDGHISMKGNGSWLHSRHAPVREAQRLIDVSFPEEPGFCIFYGFGLAYHIEIFIQRFPHCPFLVVEPDAALFKESLKHRDYSLIFQSPGFSLALENSPTVIPPLLKGKAPKDIQICMLRSLVEIHKDYFLEVDKVIQDYLSRKEINSNTLDKFSRLWVSNICSNLPFSSSVRAVNELKGIFAGHPALLIAAGPTLEEALPYLTALKERFLLVCVDTALKACLNQNIEPDFLILTDPQYWNSRHMDRCFTKKTILISDVSTYPSVLRAFRGNCYFCSTPFPLAQFFEDRSRPFGKLKSGGSVSTAAWDFCRVIGAKELFCTGLDLSFPDGETHYRGSTFEERVHTFSTRQNPLELNAWYALKGGNPYPVKNHKGEVLLTDQRMKIYINWFEKQMLKHPEFPTWQLSPRGMALEGLGYRELKECLGYPVIRPDLDAILEGLENPESSDNQEETLRQAHTELLEELNELIDLTGKASGIVQSLLTKGINQEGLDELNRLDHLIMNRESREMAGFILAPILEEHMNALNPDSKGEEVLKHSGALYTELCQSLLFHRNKIESIQF